VKVEENKMESEYIDRN